MAAWSAYQLCRWKASWQLTDAFETWRAGARHKHDMRIKTATAFEYLYLSLGQRALKSWQEGVVYNQKVTCCAWMAAGSRV